MTVESMEAMDKEFMAVARQQAQESLNHGGVPVGSTLVRDSRIIGIGHNQRVQKNDAIAHGEMDCIRKAGRQRTYKDTTLYTTLSPCMMCAGAIIQFGILRVVIGENQTFGGNEEFLRERGVEIVILNDHRCKALMDEFIMRFPNIWNEDIGEE